MRRERVKRTRAMSLNGKGERDGKTAGCKESARADGRRAGEGEQRATVSVDTRVSIYELSGAVMSGVKIHRVESVCRTRARAQQNSYNSPPR